ncbi:MAG: cyanophycinase [Firmicutes bacterium]|nr:cyanophycinase [Bacillota bacterium]
MGEKVRGNLLIIGGAEDKSGNKEVLAHLAEQIRDKGPLVLVTTASTVGAKVAQGYRAAFAALHVDMEVLPLHSREAANAGGAESALEQAGAVFFSGGDQLRLTSILGGTRFYQLLHERFAEGLLIAGTSAGAAAMSDTMIIDGEDDESPAKGNLSMAPGMGFLEEAVVDQHFAQRGRIGRLVTVVAQNPHILGIGVDENTAIHITSDGFAQVIGANTVTIIDGSKATLTNVSDGTRDGPIAIGNLTLHILSHGYRFDLSTRMPLAAE